MDPNSLKPDPEHTGYAWALLGALGYGAMWLLDRLVGRTDRDSTKNQELQRQYEEAMHQHVLAVARQFAELEMRLVRLESREVVTENMLRMAIADALKEVKDDYGPQHKELAEKVERCADKINGRIDKLAKRLPGGGGDQGDDA